MIEFLHFKPEHLAALKLQEAQAYLQPLIEDRRYAAAIAEPYLAYSGAIDGAIVGCAGIIEQWYGRGIAWALIGSPPASEWARITRQVRAVLDDAKARGMWRVETTVDADFGAGHRFAKVLGFKAEGILERYSPEGRDHIMYARLAHA